MGMGKVLERGYCRLLQLGVRSLTTVTGGKGGGRVARWLPAGQTFLVQNYCKNLRFQVDTTYPMEATLWLSGVYDSRTTRFLQQVLRPGDTVLDVGANCGALTLVAAHQVGTRGRVYAFEPGETIRQRLEANLAENPQIQSGVTVMPVGLGAATEERFYYEDPHYRGNGALFQSQGIPVSVVRLDDWVAEQGIGAIALIKIDVEGMEYDVLRGGKSTLSRYQPMIYFETLPLFYADKPYTIQTVYEFLITLGYRIVQPTPPYGEIPLTGPYPCNSVAVPPEHLSRLGLA